MNRRTFPCWWSLALVLTGSLGWVALPFPSLAENLQVPWECSNYAGDAQTRCVNALIEAQQKKIAELEGKLQAQQSTMSQLKDQLDRQSSATTDLQRQLAERPTTSVVPFSYPYPYGYAYPPGLGLGLGLNFWGAGLYAAPYYSRPFGDHRHYGYWGYRW